MRAADILLTIGLTCIAIGITIASFNVKYNADQSIYNDLIETNNKLKIAINEYKHLEKSSPIKNTMIETITLLKDKKYIDFSLFRKVADHSIFEFQLTEFKGSYFILAHLRPQVADTNLKECLLLNELTTSYNKKYYEDYLKNNSVPDISHVHNLYNLEGICFFDRENDKYTYYSKIDN
jgi:hypothetical protein